MQTRRVVIVAYPGLQTLDAAGPFEVFAGANQVAGPSGHARGSEVAGPSDHARGYEVDLVSVDAGPVRAESGMGLCAAPLPDPAAPIDTLILPGGSGVQAACQDDELLSWITRVAPRCRRVATVCSGAFLAASAGLLDGRTVTTHWARADQLAAAFPAVVVDPDPIYRRDGKFWSSAGVTAGIDLSLALVEDDLGAPVAQTVARWLVMFLHRPGGQTQFATPVWVPRAERSSVRAVQERVEASPGDDHRLEALAAQAAMSVRNFARVFAEETGETPGRFVERVRVEAARHRLETTDDTLRAIATHCGFGTDETLRRVFHRRLGVTPDAYRRRFRTGAAAGRPA
jgi:transcriptional regulator GlxA family with amidase domain